MVSGHSSWVLSVAYSPDSKYFATGYVAHAHAHTHTHAGLPYVSRRLCCVVLIAVIVTRSADKTVKVWDAAKGQCVHTFNDHTDMVWAVAFDPKGTMLASASDDKSIIVYNLAH
jgi:WD repeat-containing protein 61